MNALSNIQAALPDVESRWPDRTVTAGQRTLGFLFDNADGTVTATGPDDEPLGSFNSRELARQAVVNHAGCEALTYDPLSRPA